MDVFIAILIGLLLVCIVGLAFGISGLSEDVKVLKRDLQYRKVEIESNREGRYSTNIDLSRLSGIVKNLPEYKAQMANEKLKEAEYIIASIGDE